MGIGNPKYFLCATPNLWGVTQLRILGRHSLRIYLAGRNGLGLLTSDNPSHRLLTFVRCININKRHMA